MVDWIAKHKRWWFGLILLGLLAVAVDRWLRTVEQSQDVFIMAAALKHGVDPALIKAVIWRESRFEADAQGGKGEIGLMQISEIAAREWADAHDLKSFEHEALFDPGMNTMAGTWYLGKMIKRYLHTDNRYVYALADYNAGRTHVLRWNEGAGSTNSIVFLQQMDFPGTRNYIVTILKRYRKYAKEFHPQSRS